MASGTNLTELERTAKGHSAEANWRPVIKLVPSFSGVFSSRASVASSLGIRAPNRLRQDGWDAHWRSIAM